MGRGGNVSLKIHLSFSFSSPLSHSVLVFASPHLFFFFFFLMLFLFEKLEVGEKPLLR